MTQPLSKIQVHEYWIPDASVEADVLSQDVRWAKDAGMGGLELLGYYLYGGPPENEAGRGTYAPVDWAEYGFGGQKWYETFRAFVDAIKDNDLVMDFAIGPNQGTGVPAPEDDEGLMWDISIYNQSVRWEARLEINTTTVTATDKLQPDPEGLPGDYYLNRTQVTLSNSSLQDVTEKVDDRGQIRLAFPSTETGYGYNIFAVYVGLSGYRAQQGPEGLEGPQTAPESWLQNGFLAVDHFSAQGAKLVTDFWEQHILQNGTRELLQEIGSYAWEDSIEIASTVYWTRNLSTNFMQDHGYDISKWLPILFHRNGKSSNPNPSIWWVTDEPDGGNNHIADYRSTLAGLYREYLTSLNDWARDYLGLGFSAHISYNLPMDMLANIPFVSTPETESLDFSDLIDGYRQYSGPAYLAGHNIVSSECGAVRGEGFSQTLPELLWHVKRSYAGGINQFVFHGFPYSGQYGNTTWPGFTTFNYQYSDMHGPYQPAWQFYKEYMDFVGRNNSVLQSGEPRIDIAFWQKKTTYPGHVELRTYQPADLEEVGYSYQYLSPDDLSFTTVEDSVLSRDDQRFKAFVLRVNDSLTIDGVNKLAEFGQAGLPIIFAGGVPSSYIGTFEPDKVEQAKESLQKLTTLPNVHTIDSLEVEQTLAGIGIQPLTKISANGSWFTQWHSDTENQVDYVFVYSDAMHTPQGQGESVGTIEFESTGIPYEYDAWTGDQRPILQYGQLENTTLIPFQLAGNQSKIIAFHAESETNSSRLHHLDPWETEDLGYPYMNSSVFPELGRYSQATNATLSRLPPVDVTAPTADLKSLLRNGKNTVEAVVSTPLGNILGTIWTDLQSSGEGPASADAGTVSRPPIGQYGLRQEVEIVPYQSRAV
ncbi:hypothetical protein LQW54_003509 [Pestalotiopsis sp. IQ-011]